jgi:superfamily I DNA/RNA helicase
MTLHSAKGLEFETVYIPGAEEGILPHEKSVAEGDEAIDEERRLLYVGMTRAKRSLTLTCCTTRARRGDEAAATVSRFLADVPPELVRREQPNDRSTPLSPEEGVAYFNRLRAQRKEA